MFYEYVNDLETMADSALMCRRVAGGKDSAISPLVHHPAADPPRG